MIEDWEAAINFVLAEEGGANGELIPNDKGGYTKFGISSANNPDVDVQNLTLEGAKDIYKKRYWHPCHCDELPSPLAIAIFDGAVNQGVGGTIRALQLALGHLEVDGIMGDQTKSAIFKAPATFLLRRFLAQRMVRYIRTIMKDNTQEVFAENWANRLMRLGYLVFLTDAKGTV